MSKKEAGTLSLPIVIMLAVAIVGVLLYAKKMAAPAIQNKIQNISELDEAQRELDRVDVDGLGNEFGQLTSDAAGF